MFPAWMGLADLALDYGLNVGCIVPLTGDEKVERLQEFDGQVVAGKLAQEGDDRVALAHFDQLDGVQIWS